MILYFTDRQLNIVGQASTELPEGLIVIDDLKTEDIETGVAVFECRIPYNEETRGKVENCASVGNYILRSHNGANEFYTIIESEADTKNQEVWCYAEDAGLDLLNEIVGVYEADKAYPITHYINKFAYDSGFVIGTNEAANLTRKLAWDGESTAAERLASVASQFDCELSFSFDIDNLEITNKYINIHKERGKDIGAQLRLNIDIDRIVTKQSIANLATALEVTGGTPEDENTEDDIEPQPITLKNISYDDGDFYVDGTMLKSRKALQKWSRYSWTKEPNKTNAGGHIVRPFSHDTVSPSELLSHSLTELKKRCQIEVNYEVDLQRLPGNVRIGDRINIIDDECELYVSARILQLEESAANDKQTATIGEHLIKGSGISQKVADLAAEFKKHAQSAKRALAIANAAKAIAAAAQAQADAAATDAANAQAAADAATAAANTATQSAADANAKADAAQAAVDVVEGSVAELETTVDNAQKAADNAQQAATTAQNKADEAATAAAEAKADAANAAAAVVVAEGKAETAIEKADEAKESATTATTTANDAKSTADAAKADAKKANEDILSLGERLTTVSNTMSTDYARKTDLTETEASLQTQISQNAAQISSTASRVQTIDETANNAAEQAEAAQSAAEAAQAKADAATANATAAQSAATAAATAASNAQSEADKAKAAAATAQGVADKAKTDLEAAKADLATVQGRVDATEEEIAAAQTAVNTAQAAANKAQADATAAAQKAATAQTTADTAVTNASTAQAAANNAAAQAALAQQTADSAKGDAAAAQSKANEAAAAAETAQQTANTAKTNAQTAQTKANEAAAAAAAAQTAADDADEKAAQAAADLATAQQNLANVTARVGATEAEVAAAQQAVVTAQAAADKAKSDAAAAQSTADTAKANAATAKTAADNAKTAADNAQKDADAAQKAADDAQAAVNALAVRVTTAETKITQNSEQIALRATKTEVSTMLGGYSTTEEMQAAIELSANQVKTTVSTTYATKTDLNNKANDYTILLYNGTGGNPKPVKFATVNYSTCDSNNGVSIKIGMLSGHGNGVSYTFLQDAMINVSYVGGVTVDNIKSYGAETPEYDGAVRQYGDIFWVIDTTNKIVDFYVLMGQYAHVYQTPWKRTTYSTGGTVTQYTSCTVYSSGEKNWANNSDMALMSDINALSEEVSAKMVEQQTTIMQDSEQILLSALEEYETTKDAEAFKETVSAQLAILANEITMSFTTNAEQIAGVDGDLQSKFTELYNYIKFSGGGITISESTGLSLELAGGLIAFKKNGQSVGTWDGVDFFTGNIVVQVNERAQFGNFAFIPRSDGSLMLLKVGG